METNEAVSTAFNVGSYVSAVIQDNPVLQLILFILSVLTSLILIAYRVWKWYKEAKADGKIDKEEVSKLADILIEGADEVKDKIDKRKEDK